MSRTTLGLDGITTVPLRRVAQDVLLEGWLHYESASYRYFRWAEGPVQIELRAPDASGVSGNVVPLKAVSPDVRTLVDMGITGWTSDKSDAQILSPQGSPLFNDTFRQAAVVVHEGGRWKYRVLPVFDGVAAIEGSEATRVDAIRAADHAMSKFLVQDVHDEPVDLRGIAREIDYLRTVLAALVSPLRGRPVEHDETVRISVRGSDVLAAFQLLGIHPAEAVKEQA